jgi:hypothetical protein
MNYDRYPPSPVSRRLPAPIPGAFIQCPLWTAAAQWAWQETLYQWALKEAQAVAGPSLLERDLLAVWN